MSLRVWLPLTGTLENKGCSDLTFSYSGSNIVINDNGKIGKCYRRTTKASDAIISNKVINLGTNQSMFCWIKVDSFNSGASLTGILGLHRYSTNTGMGITLRYASASTGYASVNTGNGSSRTYNSYYGATVLNANTWYHIGYTYDGSNIRIYVNGNLDKTQAFTGMSCPADYILIGAWSFTGSSGTGIDPYSTPEYINDVRIYDHCLSAAEVHEISLGLVLHYKLDGFLGGYGNPNIIVTHSNAGIDGTGTTGWSSAGTGWANSFVTAEGATGGHAVRCTYSGTSQTSGGIHHSTGVDKTTLTTGDIYTLSARIRTSKACVVTFQNELMTTGHSINATTEWQVYTYTCAIDTSKTYLSNVMYVRAADAVQNMWIECDWIKLEKGTAATPWQPSGTIGTAILDSSGYGHNGSITGTLSLNNNSSRYTSSSYISSTEKVYITAPNFLFENMSQGTINIWINRLSTDSTWRLYTYFSNSYNWTGNTSDFIIIGSTGGQGITLDCCSNTYSFTPDLNKWYMYTITWNLSTHEAKMYVNGELKATKNSTNIDTTYASKHNNHYFGNGHSTMGDYLLSDARIYATTLSADDILSLYNTAAKIDNLGNWHTFEFKENNGIVKITKMGITETNEVYDNMNFNNRAQIVKNNAKVLIAGDLNIVTTYSSSVKTGTMPSLPGVTVQALAGKTLRFIYDVCAPGTRYSAELGLTAWSYTRYGIHGSCTMDGSTSYPFAGQLNYTGDGIHAIQTWTIPTGKSTYGDLGFSIQNFDKPSSTNNATWFIRNVRLELVDGTSENITGTQLIER